MSENPGIAAVLEALLGNSAYCVVWIAVLEEDLYDGPLSG